MKIRNGCVRNMLQVHTCSSGNRIPSDETAKYRQRTEQARNVTPHPTSAALRDHTLMIPCYIAR